MKKILLALLLCAALLLSACASAPKAEPAAPAIVETEPDPTAEPRVDPALSALLSEIRDRMHLGTAGGSLKAAALAVELLNWGVDSEADAASVNLTLSEWMAGLSSEEREEFLRQLQAVDNSLQQLLTPGEAAEALLSDAGCEDRGYPWNEKARQAAEALMAAAGLRA